MHYLLPILFAAVSVAAIEAQVRPEDQSFSRARVAVVLSGGGARGGAHIGVLRELEKAAVPIDLIVGTSYGAFIGGLYAVGYSPEDLELIVKSMDWTDLLSNRIDRRLVDYSNKHRQDRLVDLELDDWTLKIPKGLQAGPGIQQLLDRLTAQVVLDAENDFDKLPVRFRAVATDILTGKAYVFKNGSLSTAIRSSLAVPGLLTPVELDDTLLIDGGIANVLPIDIALAEGADLVIAVDVSRPLKNKKEQIESLVDVLDQVASFYAEQKKQLNLKSPAIVITPALEGFDLLDFDESYLVIERGAEAAGRALPEIARQLNATGIARNSARPRTSFLNPATLDLDHFTLSNKAIVLKDIGVEGLQRYPEPYILGYVASQPGRSTSISSIDRDISALYATGLFDAATYQLRKDGAQTRLIYKLHERAPVKIGLSARYDQDYKFTGLIDLMAHDVVAVGSDLFLKVIAGGAESIELGVNRKHLFGTDLMFSPQIVFRSQDRLIQQDGDTLGDYQDRRFGFQGSLQYPLANVGRIDLAYLWEHVDIDRGRAGFIQPSARNLAGLTAGVRFDSLNDAEFPTAGSLGEFEFEWRSRDLGSDFSYSRSTVEIDHYFSPTLGATVGLTTALGLVDGAAPFYERFYTGGAQNLSFASTRFLGLARDDILSERVGIVGISFRHPLRHFESGIFDDLYLNWEYKAGFFSRDDPNSAQITNPIHGFGIGLHLDLRVLGPMLFEFGRTSRGGLKAYFSFGSSF